MANATQYGGSQLDTSPLPSPLWADCRWNDMQAGYLRGITEYYDFATGGKITSPTTEAALVGQTLNGFSDDAIAGTPPAVITAGIAYDYAANAGGNLIIAQTTTAHQVLVRSTQSPYQISANKGTFWMEARLKQLTVAANDAGFFVGLIDSTVATNTAVLVSSTGNMAAINYVGFHKPVANSTTFNTAYRADDTDSTVDAQTTVQSGVGALVAATYVKLGMKFSPRRGNVLEFFINGVKQSSTVTVPNATGTTFPADVGLGWMIALCTGTSTADHNIYIDWIRVAQEIL